MPQNQPACWSYKTYILKNRVLGETTLSPDEYAKQKGITFPVTELGNCANATECMKFCQEATNREACSQFSQKHAMQPTSQSAQSAPTQKVNTEQFLKDAKTELGCDGYTACKAFCNQTANRQTCEAFSRKESLSSGQETKLPPKITVPNFFEVIKSQLGCDSEVTCKTVCDNPQNYYKCLTFIKTHNFLTETSKPQPIPSDGIKPTISPYSSPTNGCTTESQCYQKCLENPALCPGFRPLPKPTSSFITPTLSPLPTSSPNTQITPQ